MPETCTEIDHCKVVANRSPGATNSSWAVWVVLVLGALAFAVMWHVSRGPINVTRPRLSVAENGEVVATSKATNRTAEQVHLTVRFLLGLASTGHRPSFRGVDHLDVEIDLDPRSSKIVRCAFPAPRGTGMVKSEVQILSRN